MGINLGPPPTETFQEEYQVGTEVEYLPHECHSLNYNQNNEYPWVIGKKQNPRYETNPQTGVQELVEEVEEVEEGRLHRTVIPNIHRSPNGSEERKRLVPLRPRHPWPAKVTRVNPDGTLDLDILSNIGNGMVTLGYRKVPVDETGRIPHSCRRKGER